MSRIHKAILIILFITMICFLAVSCDYLPSPYEVIRAPMGYNNDDIEIDVTRFIPEGMILLTSANSGRQYRMRFTDIENDDQEELVVFYGDPETFKCKGIVILKYSSKWTEYYVQLFAEGTRYNVESALFEDLTGNGYRELIIELSSFNNIKIFTLIEFMDKVSKLYTFGGNKLDIIQVEGSSPVLAVWTLEEEDIHNIDLIKWEDDGFILATYDYPGYFLQITPLLENMVTEEPDNTIALLYYADTLMKSGDYQKALETINQYIEIENETNSSNRVKAYLIKGRCQFSLGMTKAAGNSLSAAKALPDYDIETILEVKSLMIDILLILEDYESAVTELNGFQSFLYQFLNSDYKSHVWYYEYDVRAAALAATSEK